MAYRGSRGRSYPSRGFSNYDRGNFSNYGASRGSFSSYGRGYGTPYGSGLGYQERSFLHDMMAEKEQQSAAESTKLMVSEVVNALDKRHGKQDSAQTGDPNIHIRELTNAFKV